MMLVVQILHTEKHQIFTMVLNLRQIWQYRMLLEIVLEVNTWVSIHNGGGVGWGEVINGGFGLMLDGTKDSERRLKSILFTFWDVNNGISRRFQLRNNNLF